MFLHLHIMQTLAGLTSIPASSMMSENQLPVNLSHIYWRVQPHVLPMQGPSFCQRSFCWSPAPATWMKVLHTLLGSRRSAIGYFGGETGPFWFRRARYGETFSAGICLKVLVSFLDIFSVSFGRWSHRVCFCLCLASLPNLSSRRRACNHSGWGRRWSSLPSGAEWPETAAGHLWTPKKMAIRKQTFKNKVKKQILPKKKVGNDVSLVFFCMVVSFSTGLSFGPNPCFTSAASEGTESLTRTVTTRVWVKAGPGGPRWIWATTELPIPDGFHVVYVVHCCSLNMIDWKIRIVFLQTAPHAPNFSVKNWHKDQ